MRGWFPTWGLIPGAHSPPVCGGAPGRLSSLFCLCAAATAEEAMVVVHVADGALGSTLSPGMPGSVPLGK